MDPTDEQNEFLLYINKVSVEEELMWSKAESTYPL